MDIFLKAPNQSKKKERKKWRRSILLKHKIAPFPVPFSKKLSIIFPLFPFFRSSKMSEEVSQAPEMLENATPAEEIAEKKVENMDSNRGFMAHLGNCMQRDLLAAIIKDK